MDEIVSEWQPHLRGYTVEWVDENGYILSRGCDLLSAVSLARDSWSPMPFTEFPAGNLYRLGSRFRYTQRLLRLLFYNVLRLSHSRYLLTFGKDVATLQHGRLQRVGGLGRRARFLRGGIAIDGAGGAYFGEYLSNDRRGPITIYYLPPHGTAVVAVYKFGSGAVRHVHGVYRDPFDGSFWCTTGDIKSECAIWRSTDGFATVEVVGRGDETWRAVSLVFTETAVLYGMDAEYCQNYLFRLDKRSGVREQLGAVDGPVYYSTTLGGDALFGVTAEGCPSQAINAASLWRVGGSGECMKLVSIRKDWLPKQFMPGTLHFSLGPGSLGHETYVYCHGLSRRDGHVLKVSCDSSTPSTLGARR